MQPYAEIQLLRKLVSDLSNALTDEGATWSSDGLHRMRRRVACVLPEGECPEWLLPFRPAHEPPTVSSK